MAIRSLLDSISSYLRDLDDRSRRRMSHDVEQQAGAAEERSERREVLELEISLFLRTLPAWVAHPDRFRDPLAAAAALDPAEVVAPEGGTPGADWVTAADVQLELAGSLWRRLWPLRRGQRRPDAWVVSRVSRGRRREVLVRGTRLRLVGQAAGSWPGREADAPLTLDDAQGEQPGLVYEVLEGTAAGRLVRIAALPGRASPAALVAAAMIAPAGHRIADWPSAAGEVLARLERRAASAERSAGEVAYEERWAWRHDLIGRPIATPVGVRRERSEDERRPK